ncbi:MAG: molybdate ABC transporter substrate-binding protein [Spirochaetales bacterium]|nr:molybdate ABC transporter substrate-binding protein [Spirochaetales bacterium]
MKKIIKIVMLTFIPVILLSSSAKNESLILAAGAGYKKPVMEICKEFTADTGIKVENIFGNMQTVSTQVKQSGKVGVLIGDISFLKNPRLGVEYSEYKNLGTGKLVLAYPRGIKISSTEELLDSKISRISMPDIKKAIYGKAAKEYIENTNLWNSVQDKIIPAATVPQVSSYLVAGEVDAGFINLTDAIGIKDKIGGYFLVDKKYSSIEIVAGTISGFENELPVKEFIKFLSTDKAKKILDKYGL